MTSIHSLPRDISRQVASYLSPNTLSNAASVSKAFKFIFDDESLWKKIGEKLNVKFVSGKTLKDQVVTLVKSIKLHNDYILLAIPENEAATIDPDPLIAQGQIAKYKTRVSKTINEINTYLKSLPPLWNEPNIENPFELQRQLGLCLRNNKSQDNFIECYEQEIYRVVRDKKGTQIVKFFALNGVGERHSVDLMRCLYFAAGIKKFQKGVPCLFERDIGDVEIFKIVLKQFLKCDFPDKKVMLQRLLTDLCKNCTKGPFVEILINSNSYCPRAQIEDLGCVKAPGFDDRKAVQQTDPYYKYGSVCDRSNRGSFHASPNPQFVPAGSIVAPRECDFQIAIRNNPHMNPKGPLEGLLLSRKFNKEKVLRLFETAEEWWKITRVIFGIALNNLFNPLVLTKSDFEVRIYCDKIKALINSAQLNAASDALIKEDAGSPLPSVAEHHIDASLKDTWLMCLKLIKNFDTFKFCLNEFLASSLVSEVEKLEILENVLESLFIKELMPQAWKSIVLINEKNIVNVPLLMLRHFKPRLINREPVSQNLSSVIHHAPNNQKEEILSEIAEWEKEYKEVSLSHLKQLINHTSSLDPKVHSKDLSHPEVTCIIF